MPTTDTYTKPLPMRLVEAIDHAIHGRPCWIPGQTQVVRDTWGWTGAMTWEDLERLDRDGHLSIIEAGDWHPFEVDGRARVVRIRDTEDRVVLVRLIESSPTEDTPKGGKSAIVARDLAELDRQIAVERAYNEAVKG